MLAVRLAGAADRAARGDAAEAALLRLALPAAKYWVCKRFPAHAAEALECLGGNGYVEESGLPRLYREAPLNSIWEGSGNVTSLDVLRALARTRGRGRGAAGRAGRWRRARTRALDGGRGRPAAPDGRAGGGDQPGGAAAGAGGWPGQIAVDPAGGAAGAARARGPVAGRVLRVPARAAGARRPRYARSAAAGRARPDGRSSTGPVPSAQRVASADAALARNPLPAGRDLGRGGHQLRAVLRGGGARSSSACSDGDGDGRRPHRDPGRADRGGRVRLARLPARRRAPGSATATGCTGRTSPPRGTAATRRSCCSTRTARRWTARSSGTRRCSGTASATRPAPSTADSAPYMPRRTW